MVHICVCVMVCRLGPVVSGWRACSRRSVCACILLQTSAEHQTLPEKDQTWQGESAEMLLVCVILYCYQVQVENVHNVPGREFRALIISTVRTCSTELISEREAGFLTNPKVCVCVLHLLLPFVTLPPPALQYCCD